MNFQAFLWCFLNWWKPLKPNKMVFMHDKLAIGGSLINEGGDGESRGDNGSNDQRRDCDSSSDRWPGYQQRRLIAAVIGSTGKPYTDKDVIDHIDRTVIICKLWTMILWTTNLRTKMRTNFREPMCKRWTRKKCENLNLFHEDKIELLENQNLIAEFFANSGYEPYFEGFSTSKHAKSSPSEEDSTSKSDDELQMCKR